MRRGTALLLAAILLLAGCGPLGGRQFEVVLLHLGGDVRPLPVTLTDTTGTLIGLEAADPDGAWSEGVSALPGDSHAVVVSWVGGMCDNSVTLRLEDRSGSRRVIGSTDRGFGGCLLAGIGRSIVLRFLVPVDPARFTTAIDQNLSP